MTRHMKIYLGVVLLQNEPRVILVKRSLLQRIDVHQGRVATFTCLARRQDHSLVVGSHLWTWSSDDLFLLNALFMLIKCHIRVSQLLLDTPVDRRGCLDAHTELFFHLFRNGHRFLILDRGSLCDFLARLDFLELFLSATCKYDLICST